MAMPMDLAQVTLMVTALQVELILERARFMLKVMDMELDLDRGTLMSLSILKLLLALDLE
jgi:hypothetical protein